MKNIKRFLLFVFLFTAIPLISASEETLRISNESLKRVSQLNSNWYFIPNDNILYAERKTSDEKWYKDDPTHWWKDDVPEAAHYEGNAWYTLSFQLESLKDIHKIGIAIPFSYGGYQLYINGKMLYESGDFADTSKLFGSVPTVVEIPYKLLNSHKNRISLRVSTINTVGGFIGNGLEKPYIKIGPYKKIMAQWVRYLITYIAIGSISFFLFIFFIFRYCLNRYLKFNLYFSLLALSIALFIVGYNGFILYISNTAWAYWYITFVSGIGMYLLPILFTHAFFNLKKGPLLKTFTFFHLALIAIISIEYLFTSEIRFFMTYIYNFFNLSYILSVFYLLSLSINSIRKKLEYSKLMFIAVLILALSFIYSMMTFIGIIKHIPLIGEGFFLMVLVFSFVLARRFARTHSNLEVAHAGLIEASDEIKALNLGLEDKVRQRTAELQEKNNQITESIEYASLIQHSVQPLQKDLTELFADHFIIWRPRDIVGGDIYWLNRDEKGFLLAVIDCTGHGVPGSLLTMTAVATLDHVTNHMHIREPGEVLFHLNRLMKSRLNQGNTSEYVDDGMEIGIVAYDAREKALSYVGSRIRLHLMSEGTLQEYKGDKQGIGYKRSAGETRFTVHRLPLSPSTRYYLTTDGYIEQSGGEKRFGFGWTRYRELLASRPDADMAERQRILEEAFDKYRGKLDQRDDVLVLGFQMKM